jgi:LacI family transcriptional regulator
LLIGRNRKSGFIRALNDHNLTVDENNIIRCDTEDYAMNIVPGLLHRISLPAGIFAVNDLTAATVMKIVKSSGYNVPDDISIIGFTCGLISNLTDPQLTSVFQDGYSVGREAIRLLFERLGTIRKIHQELKS